METEVKEIQNSIPAKKSEESFPYPYGELIMKGTIRCARCDSIIKKEGACPKCGSVRCYILIYWKRKSPYKIRRDRKTREPLQYLKALDILLEINRHIKNNTFNIYDWISSKLKETFLGYKLDQWIKAKEEDFKSGEFSGETLKNYKGYVRNYYKKFKIESNGNAGWTNNQDDPFLLINWNVTEIRKTEIAKFKKELMKIEKLKIKTKKNILNALHAFFTWLATEDPDELISLKDIPDFPKISGDDSEPRKALDYDLQIKGIQNIPEEHRDIIEFGCEEFLRPGELCALKIKDIDFANKTLIVRRTWSGSILRENTKQKKWKIKPLTQRAYEIAKKHAKNKFPEDFLFINPKTRRCYRPKTLNNIWKKYSGTDTVYYEGSRHSSLTQLAEAGYDITAVKELAGHSDIRTTVKYVHLSLSKLREIANNREKNIIQISTKKEKVK